MTLPNIILSIDVPGRATGGFIRWDRALNSVSLGTLRFKQTGSEAEDYRRLLTAVANQKPNLIIIEHPFLYVIQGPIGGLKAWAAWNHIPWWMVTASGAKKAVLNNGRASKADVLAWAKRTLATRWRVIQPEAISQHQADALLYLVAWERAHEEMRPEYNIRGGTRGKYHAQYDPETDPRFQDYKDAVKENLLK